MSEFFTLVNPYTFFWKSSIGKKWLVALTGLVLIGYVIGHLGGNLQVFGGAALINRYAEFLHSIPVGLWAARLVLLACFILHIAATIKLTMENRAATPEKYAVTKRQRSTLAARTMAISGLIVLTFVIYHLLHLTMKWTDARFQTREHGGLLTSETDVYTMLVLGFQNPLVSGFYLLGIFLLCLHLSHGFSSLVQTFGINSKTTMAQISWGGRALAWIIFVGYASIPVAVLTGYLKL